MVHSLVLNLFSAKQIIENVRDLKFLSFNPVVEDAGIRTVLPFVRNRIIWGEVEIEACSFKEGSLSYTSMRRIAGWPISSSVFVWKKNSKRWTNLRSNEIFF
jgi:hypothetical protein